MMSHLAVRLEYFLKRTNRFTRFLLVGVLNTLTGLSIIFTLLNVLEWSYWISSLIGNGIGGMLSYFLNRLFTFQSNIGFTSGAPRFFIVVLLCYFLSFSSSEIFASWIYSQGKIHPPISTDELAILIGSGLYTLSNYFGQKHFIFNK